MVEQQISRRGIRDPRVLNAFTKVEREFFVPENEQDLSYHDGPLPIGFGQTISQPYIVALMTEALAIESTSRVLEIGTGSGYQAAILSKLARMVYSVERIPELAQNAQGLLGRLGYTNVKIKTGDGTLGWTEESPFDRIIITAATPEAPGPLIEQLKEGGIIVYPQGKIFFQDLMAAKKVDGELKAERLCGCMFVPLIGKYGMKND